MMQSAGRRAGVELLIEGEPIETKGTRSSRDVMDRRRHGSVPPGVVKPLDERSGRIVEVHEVKAQVHLHAVMVAAFDDLRVA